MLHTSLLKMLHQRFLKGHQGFLKPHQRFLNPHHSPLAVTVHTSLLRKPHQRFLKPHQRFLKPHQKAVITKTLPMLQRLLLWGPADQSRWNRAVLL